MARVTAEFNWIRRTGPAVLSCLLLGSCAGNGPVQTRSDSIEQFVRDCSAQARLAVVPKNYRVRTFGSNPEAIVRLLGLISAGEKTGTFTSPWIYERELERKPVRDGYTVVMGPDREPRLLLRTVELQMLTFETITEDHARFDGPGARELSRWRDIHLAFFTRELARHGMQPQSDMPVVLERFKVICE